MEIKNEYLRDLYRRVEKRDPNEPEFLQAVGEVLQSLAPVADRRPDLIDWGVFERIVEPERMITFRVLSLIHISVSQNRAEDVQPGDHLAQAPARGAAAQRRTYPHH